MAAVVEHLSSLIRQGPQCHEHGDPYRWSVTVRWLSPVAVELVGVDQHTLPSTWRDVVACLDRLGVRQFLIQRVVEGDRSIKWVAVRQNNIIPAIEKQ